MSEADVRSLLRSVDAVQIPVTDLEAALEFYRDGLGQPLRWRTDTEAGLGLPDAETEIVLTTERDRLETNLLVDSADDAVQQIVDRGGEVVVPPFDIPVGRVAVVRDPFGNELVVLDLAKGRYVTDASGRVTGVE